jgi:hypothetical protein
LNPIELIKAKNQHIARLANQGGAAGESYAIGKMSNWVSRPRGNGLKVLLTALHKTGLTIKWSSFDAIALPSAETIDFTNLDAVEAALPKMVFIEIKTANQKRVGAGFSGFFFALTESEIAASDVLGSRHQVALYNTFSGELMMTSVPEIIARAKSKNWQLSVQL